MDDHVTVFVIGGSAGSIEALEQIAPALPPDFMSPVLLVVHVPPDAPSMLPSLLERWGNLPAHHVQQDEPLEGGIIYVAPPDRHMAIRNGKACVLRGARVNRNRPSIDPLFISAAHAYRERTVGVLLSGYLDDGVQGLVSIKQNGGIVIVQDPASTIHSDMPSNALARVEADFKLGPDEIGPKMRWLAEQQGRDMRRDAVQRIK